MPPTPIAQLKREAIAGLTFYDWHAANEERGRKLDAYLEKLAAEDNKAASAAARESEEA